MQVWKWGKKYGYKVIWQKKWFEFQKFNAAYFESNVHTLVENLSLKIVLLAIKKLCPRFKGMFDDIKT